MTTSWIVHAGAAGFVTQCNGIARALGLKAETYTLSIRGLLRWTAPWGPAPNNVGLDPPWPDLVIASGRMAIPFAREVKKRSRGRSFVVVLQDPVASRGLFDLVWIPEHDAVSGPNVLSTLTSPHDLVREELQNAAAAFPLPDLARGGPKVAVLLGGPNRVFRFGPMEADLLAARLEILIGAGAEVFVTPSRRTDPRALMRLWTALHGRAWIWDGSGANPYRAMLGLADALVVSCDSVNMAGEAAFTGRPVYLERLPGGSPKFDRFHRALIDQGIVRWFEGSLDTWDYPPVDATQTIAAEIRRRYREHTGRDL